MVALAQGAGQRIDRRHHPVLDRAVALSKKCDAPAVHVFGFKRAPTDAYAIASRRANKQAGAETPDARPSSGPVGDCTEFGPKDLSETFDG